MTAPLPLIDIGANLTSRQFAPDLPAVIERARAAGVHRMIVTGLTVPLSWAAMRLAAAHPGVLWSTAGIHPHNARTGDARTIDELHRLCQHEPVAAVGECGLDYDRNFSPPEVQRRWFAAQLDLAAEVGKPVFLHERAAHRDFCAIWREHAGAVAGGVVHCFTGGAAELDAYLELGLHIGITGWICDDRRGRGLRDLVGRIPPDRLMIETDAPFLRPRDLPGSERRNEPANLPHILERVASWAGTTPEALARTTAATADALFFCPPARGRRSST